MSFATKAVSLWTADDVCQWLDSIALGALGPAFRGNGVTGPDLFSLTQDDLTGSFGCTAFQAKKVLGEVQRLSGLPPAASAPPAPSPFESVPRSATPPMPQTYPPPAGYPPPGDVPPPMYPPPPPSGSQPMHPYPSQPMAPQASQPMALQGSQPGTPAGGGSVEMERLRQELEREKMKNDLRQEIDVKSRLAAVEQSGKSGGPSVVVQQSTVAAAPAYVAAPTETYCGPISLLIGIFLFPCICFCPIDRRPVPVVAVPVRY